MSVRVSCDSIVDHVTVYPRGALVSRTVRTPEGLSTQHCELVIAGLPRDAEPSSVRVHAVGKRRVTATRARLVTPDEGRPASPSRVERAELSLQKRALELSLTVARSRRRLVAETTDLDPGLGAVRVPHDPRDLIRHSRAMAAMLDDVARDADGAVHDLGVELAQLELRLLALDLAERAAPTETGVEPHLEVRIELGPGEGPPGLSVEYVVRAARYWPAYTIRFSDRGGTAVVSFEPFVVQTSAEDWTDVRLSIATGDLVTDGTLPRLPSLRFGRAQVVKSIGYRPLPPDTRRLFEGFDAAWKLAPFAAGTMAGPVAAPAAEAAARYESGAVDGGGADRSEEEHAPRGGYAPGSVRASPAPSMPLPMAASKSRALLPFGAGSAAPIVAVAMSRSPSPARASMPAGGMGLLPGGGGSLGQSAGPSAAPKQLSPTDDLLDFDGLVLPPPRSSDRGRLVASVAPSEQKRLSLFVEIPPPKEARDPGAAGLLFDHVFHGTTTCRVPSSARPVRVPVDRRPARSTPRLAVVPRENAEVFREADVDNPFDGPLLPGPVDVLLDGSLVAEASLSLVDRGGRARVGMGVEDRVKVARNVRIEEKSAGLLGGQRTVDHAVTIDVVSSLPYPALLEIRDRTPCTEEDSGVEVKLVSATPAPHAKDIDGAGAILRGGLLWQLPLDAGAAAKVAFQYRIALSAKDEVVGGNRRD